MGACDYTTTSHGKTVHAAYLLACHDARAYSGHQEGYSGDIQTSSGCQEYRLPKGINAQRMLAWAAAISEAVWADEAAHEDEKQARHPATTPSLQARLQKQAAKSRKDAERARKRVPETHRGMATRIANDIREKRGRAVALQLTGAALKQYKETHAVPRGDKVWIFTGTAAC